MKYTINILTILFLLGVAYYFYSSQNKQNIQINKLLEEIAKTESLPQDNASINSDNSDDKILNRVNKFGATVIQIGGAGSRVIQTTSYNLEDHEYFSNNGNWISYSLNGPADLMYIDCRDGYKMSSCNNELGEIKLLDSRPACGISLPENVPQNRINVECIKK